jgi:ABC-type transport system involved in Fe-S cluster assembly fused permease/ATPase subunit
MRGRLRSDFEPNEIDTPNLNTARDSPGRLRLYETSMNDQDDDLTKVEDDAFIEYDASTNLEDDASTSVEPSLASRIFRTSAAVSFLVLIGVGGAFAWRTYTQTEMIRAAELQQQLNSIARDLAAVKQTLHELSVNQSQLTRKQDEMARTQEQMAQSIELQAAKQELTQKLSSPSVNKHAPVPPPKLVHSAELPAHASSKPLHLSPPQSLQPPSSE